MQQINRVIFFQTNKRSNETLKTTRYYRIVESITIITDKGIDCVEVINGKIKGKISRK